jgi:regulatory protein
VRYLGDSPFDPPGFGTLGGKRRRPREADERDLLRRFLYEEPPGDATVDEVRPSGRNPSIWRVGVRSESLDIERFGVARLDRSAIDALQLKSGQPWDAALAERVLAAAHADAARRYALNALSMRAMSTRRLADSMVRRGTPRAIALRIVSDLEKSGLVDDRLLAEQIARSVLATNPSGTRVIEQRLIRRGISSEIAREVAVATTEDRDPDADAMRVAQKKIRGMAPKLERDVVERRVLGALARRGFAPDVCRRTAREVAVNGWPVRR